MPRRADQLQNEERRLLREWERSRRRFAAADQRLQNQTAAWEARILKAMRWPEARAWWRTNRRVEARERWIGHDAEARRLQRVVFVTRARVLELAARREAALAPLRLARVETGRELRDTTRRLVATVGRQRALFVLGVRFFVLRDLVAGKPERIATEPGAHGAASGRR